MRTNAGDTVIAFARTTNSAAEALSKIQAEYFDQNYDIESVYEAELQSSLESLNGLESGQDEFGLLDETKQRVAMLRGLKLSDAVGRKELQISLLRKILEYGEGLGNVLDIISVGSTEKLHSARILSDIELKEHIGTNTPSLDQITNWLNSTAELEMGFYLCVPTFEQDEQVGWLFAGSSI